MMVYNDNDFQQSIKLNFWPVSRPCQQALSAAQAQKSSKSGSDFQGLLRYEGDNLYQLHKSGCIKEANVYDMFDSGRKREQ